jgi:hypothetical protein
MVDYNISILYIRHIVLISEDTYQFLPVMLEHRLSLVKLDSILAYLYIACMTSLISLH